MFFKDFVSVKRQKIKRGASQTYDTPSSTSHLGLLPSGKKRETAPPRRSEPLRSKVGGASKPSPYFAGWDRQGIAVYSLQLIVYSLRLILR